MGNRYVWSVFKIKNEVKKEQAALPCWTGVVNFDPDLQPTPVGYISKDYEIGSYGLEDAGFRIPDAKDAEVIITDEFKDADTMKFFFPPVSEVYNPFILERRIPKSWWWGTNTSGFARHMIGVNCYCKKDFNSQTAPCYKLTVQYVQGDSLNSFRTSRKKDEYPTVPTGGVGTEPAGLGGGYVKRWMVYQGFDIVDPEAIQYSPENIKAGDTVTLTVVPSHFIKFGGQLLYKLEYSTDDYSASSSEKKWVTAYYGQGLDYAINSIDVSIPDNARQFVARATVSDAWGYLQENPTYGATVNVEKEADITPKKVYYSSNEPKKIGDEFVIHVTPSDEYSGALFYQYQYRNSYEIAETSPDWANISPNTTSTSKKITLDPVYDKNATIFQAQVRAGTRLNNQGSLDRKDGKLSEWVRGPVLNVTKGLSVNVGIDNRAKIVSKIYIGVGNTAREVTAGCVGVDETAKKWG